MLVRVSETEGQVIRETIDIAFSPDTASWHLQPSGHWQRHHLDENGDPLGDYQELLIRSHPISKHGIESPSAGVLEGLLSKVGLRGR